MTDYKTRFENMKEAFELSESNREIEREEAAREAAFWRASNKNLLDANAALLKITEEQAAEIAGLRQLIKRLGEINEKGMNDLGKEIILGIADKIPSMMKAALDPRETEAMREADKMYADFFRDTLKPTAKAKNPKKAKQ